MDTQLHGHTATWLFSHGLSVVHALQIQDTVAEIQERHEAVVGLEKSLMELHQIFLDMAVLVEAQGAMLDNIENQVSVLALHDRSGKAPLLTAIMPIICPGAHIKLTM